MKGQMSHLDSWVGGEIIYYAEEDDTMKRLGKEVLSYECK